MSEMKTLKRAFYAVFSLVLLYSLLVMNGTIVRAEGDEDISDNLGAYRFHYFAEDYDEEKFIVNADKKLSVAPVDPEKITSGLLISGKVEKFNSASIVYKKDIEFSSGTTNKVRVEGLAKAGTKIFLEFYLDYEEEPFVKTQLKCQKAEDDWSAPKYSFIELDTLKTVGTHTLTIKVKDVNTLPDKKTAAMIKSFKFYKEGAPTVYIYIDESLGTIADMNASPDHSVNCYGEMILETPEGFKSDYQDAPYDKRTLSEPYRFDYIRGRGNSTWDAKKKPYKIKLKDSVDFYGMGANKHWALIANYYDGTLIRNRFTYYLGEAMNMLYTPKLIPVDVVMNDVYLGSYYLSEVVRIDESRVNIKDLEEAPYEDKDISGGYLLGMSPYGKEEGLKFVTTEKVPFVVESPEKVDDDDDEGTRISAMNEYIEEYINQTEAAIFGEDFKDENGKSYTEYMDLESAAKYFLFQSFTRNGDAYANPSTKLYKPENDKLYWGPIWDFDYVAWCYMDPDNPEDYTGFGNSNCWFERLMGDPAFVQAIWDQWYGTKPDGSDGFRNHIISIVADGGKIDQYAKQLLISTEANYDIPGNTFFTNIGLPDDTVIPDSSYDPLMGEGDNIGENDREQNPYVEEVVKYTNAEDYLAEIDRQKRWIANRLKWYDENIERIASGGREEYTVKFFDGDKLLAEKKVMQYQSIEDFPEKPVKEGYIFTGWYGDIYEFDYETGERVKTYGKLTEEAEIFGDSSFSAKWVAESEIVKTDEIYLPFKDIYMTTGMSIDLQYTVLPLEAAEQGVEITSSDKSVANINEDGELCAFWETGDAVITVTTLDGKSASFTVHNVPEDEIIKAEDFEISDTSVTLAEGETKAIQMKILPEGAKYITYNTIITDDDVAILTEGGVIMAKKAGTTNIIIYLPELKIYRQIAVTVTDPNEKPEDDYLNIKKLKAGTIFASGKLAYKVATECTVENGKLVPGTVQVTGLKKKAKNKTASVVIPAKVTSENNSFKVVSVKAGAFKNDKKLKKITIGANVTSIGKNAFFKCKKLTNITFTAKKCTFGKNAFAKISKKAKFKVPASKLKAYRKALKKIGIAGKKVTK